MTTDLRHLEVWRGEHQSIQYKIHKTVSYNNHPLWCYYLFIPDKQVPDYFESFWLPPKLHQIGDSRPRMFHDYMDCPLAYLDWHGGITFYQKHTNDEGRWVEVGCDFDHTWDREAGFPYNVKLVQREAINTCVVFRQLFPLTLWRCNWNGQYYPMDQGGITKDGIFYSYEGLEHSASSNFPPPAVEPPCPKG